MLHAARLATCPGVDRGVARRCSRGGLLGRVFRPLDGNPLDDFHAMYFIPADNALAVSGWPELRSCQSSLGHSAAKHVIAAASRSSLSRSSFPRGPSAIRQNGARVRQHVKVRKRRPSQGAIQELPDSGPRARLRHT
jgi:hypothetical protein